MKSKQEYEAPRITSADVVAEKGFISSALQYDKTPSMNYGDDEEQWF